MTLTHGVVSSFPLGRKCFLVFCFDKNIDSQYMKVVNNFFYSRDLVLSKQTFLTLLILTSSGDDVDFNSKKR